MRDNAVLCIDPDYVSVASLRPIQQGSTGKTGDSEKRMMLAEYCLVVESGCSIRRLNKGAWLPFSFRKTMRLIDQSGDVSTYGHGRINRKYHHPDGRM